MTTLDQLRQQRAQASVNREWATANGLIDLARDYAKLYRHIDHIIHNLEDAPHQRDSNS